MNKPEWGIYPENVTPRLYWGARAIITRGRLDLLPDRQSFYAADESEKGAFIQWIDGALIPFLNEHAADGDTGHLEYRSENGRYVCIAEDRSSGGYLYIGAYAV